jgi:hypothetical protein
LGWLPLVYGQPATPTVTTSEAARKAEILDSDCWRRAMFELNEWFRTQTLYTPEEAANLKSDFAQRVDTMSISELQDVISDMETKFKILNTPEVGEVRAWFGQYMSVLADRRRDEILRDIPNFATMTPAQLSEEILKIQRKKQRMRSSQAAFDRNRQAQVDAQIQANRAAQDARPRRTVPPAAYRSPYRPAPRERPFEDVEIGRRRNMIMSPYGGLYFNMGF